MAAQPARKVSEQQSDNAQTLPQYFKAGTIERIYDDCGAADGRRLPFQSKAIAAFFVLKAQKQRDYSFVMSESQICERLGIDGKTFRKYLAPLVEGGLVSIDKNRELATRRFSCKALFQRYAEDAPSASRKVMQFGKGSQTEQIGKVSRPERQAAREDMPADRETTLSLRELAPSEWESFPDSIYSSSSSYDFNSLKDRWGLKTTEGTERELRFIAEAFETFAITERRQRALIKRYGIYGVAGAAAYVKEQQSLTTIQSPGGLLDWALKNGHSAETEPWLVGKDSRTGEETASEPGAQDRILGDLWDAAVQWLEPRLSAAEFGMLIKPIRAASFDNGLLTLHVSNIWLRERINDKVKTRIVEALEALIGPPVKVEINVS